MRTYTTPTRDRADVCRHRSDVVLSIGPTLVRRRHAHWEIYSVFLATLFSVVRPPYLAWEGSNYPSRSCNGPNGPKGSKFKTKQKRDKMKNRLQWYSVVTPEPALNTFAHLWRQHSICRPLQIPRHRLRQESVNGTAYQIPQGKM